MNCPVDATELRITERQGIEIDYCPKCRGVWLDRGELDKLIDRAIPPDRDDRDVLRDRAPYPDRDDRYRARDRDDDDRDDRRDRDDDHRRRKKRKSLLDDLFDFD